MDIKLCILYIIISINYLLFFNTQLNLHIIIQNSIIFLIFYFFLTISRNLYILTSEIIIQILQKLIIFNFNLLQFLVRYSTHFIFISIRVNIIILLAYLLCLSNIIFINCILSYIKFYRYIPGRRIKSNEKCSICYDKNINWKLPCNHKFSKNCLNKWFMKNKSCPTCRTSYDYF